MAWIERLQVVHLLELEASGIYLGHLKCCLRRPLYCRYCCCWKPLPRYWLYYTAHSTTEDLQRKTETYSAVLLHLLSKKEIKRNLFSISLLQ